MNQQRFDWALDSRALLSLTNVNGLPRYRLFVIKKPSTLIGMIISHPKYKL